MKSKNSLGKLKAPTGVRSMRMLDTAKVNTDPPRKRGEVCRGAYIADETGCFYLTTRGTWTHGIQGADNFWLDGMTAENYLAGLVAKTQVSNSKHTDGTPTNQQP